MPKNTAPAPPRYCDWSSLHYHLLWAYDGDAPQVAREGRYTSHDTSCWLVRKGSVTLTTPGQRAVVAKAGQWAFVASPVRHQRFSEDAKILSLHFQLSWPGGVQVVNRAKNRVVDASRIPGLERAAMPVARLLARHFPGANAYLPDKRCDRTTYLKTQALLPGLLTAYLDAQETLGALSPVPTATDARVSQAAARLERMPVDRSRTHANLAQDLGLSRTHLQTLFVAEHGMTPRRFLERRRKEAAERLLGTTTHTIKEVAAEMGFRHASHFCIWFKRLTGLRPGEWRERQSA